MFVGKARSLPECGEPESSFTRVGLPANIGLVWKGLPWTNTLSYYELLLKVLVPRRPFQTGLRARSLPFNRIPEKVQHKGRYWPFPQIRLEMLGTLPNMNS